MDTADFRKSPLAEGRVERTVGTIQDQMVTELRLAGVRNIDEVSEVMNSLLIRLQRGSSEYLQGNQPFANCFRVIGVLRVSLGSSTAAHWRGTTPSSQAAYPATVARQVPA